MADQELIVKFKGDTDDIEQAFERVNRLMDTGASVTDKAERSTRKFERANRDLNDAFGNIAKGYLGFTAIMQGGKMFLDATNQVQKYENQLKVASGTQEDYAKNTAFLEGLADKYNKNVLELGKSYAQLTIATRGTNIEGEKADRLFAAVTATSSALQLSVDETNGTFKAFIDMVSKGNVQAEELRGQLGDRLVGAFGLAAQSMGVSTSQLNKMLESGDVLASELLPKLTTELEKTFGAQAQENANNLGSNIDYATGQLTLLFGEFGKSSGITSGLNDMASAMGDLFSWLRKLNTESGIADGFFDRMLTLPGNSLTGGSKTQTPEQKAKAELDKIMAGMGKMPGATFSKSQSTTDSNAYGAQYGIRDLNAKAEDKIRKSNEAAARKAQATIDKQVAKWIQESKDRIAEGIAEAESRANTAFRTHNSDIDAPGYVLPGGTKNTYSMNGGEMRKTGQVFANESTGDGSATNYDHIIEGMDEAIAQIKIRYAEMESETTDFGERLNQNIKAALANAIASAAEGIGTLAAGLATGTADLSDVGNTFLSIVANLFQQIGDALSSYAAMMLVADIAMSTMNPAGALVGAALAYGAAALARSQIQESGQDAFFSSGVVGGPAGPDKNLIRASRGEVVLNKNDQGRLMGMINGAYSNSDLMGGSLSRSGRGSTDVVVRVEGRIKRGDIDLSGRQGARDNAYFGMKRRN